MIQRRSLILGALAAPFIARTPRLLMPVKPVPETLMLRVGGIFLVSGDAVLVEAQIYPVWNGVWHVNPSPSLGSLT